MEQEQRYEYYVEAERNISCETVISDASAVPLLFQSIGILREDFYSYERDRY